MKPDFHHLLGLKAINKRGRSYEVGMIPRGAREMLNGRRKWRKKIGNDAGNGVFLVKVRFSITWLG